VLSGKKGGMLDFAKKGGPNEPQVVGAAGDGHMEPEENHCETQIRK
jgi:hypothetical protein